MTDTLTPRAERRSMSTHTTAQLPTALTRGRGKPVSITAARAHARHRDRQSTPIDATRRSRQSSSRIVLTDGSATLVRRVRPSDADGLWRFLDGLSSESVYLRFCSGGPNLSAAVGQFVEISDDRFGLVACDPDGEIVAHTEYLLLGSDAAEEAIVVADRLHSRGLGRAMIDLLMMDAQPRGIERIVASVLPENAPMLAIFAHAFGATVNETPEECEVSFAIAPAGFERPAA